MVSINSNDDEAPRIENLSVGDQLRVAVGRVIAEAMFMAIKMSKQEVFVALNDHDQAMVMTNMTVHYVRQMEEAIVSFEGRECE